MAQDTVYLPQQKQTRGTAGWKVQGKPNYRVVDPGKMPKPSADEMVITADAKPRRRHRRGT